MGTENMQSGLQITSDIFWKTSSQSITYTQTLPQKLALVCLSQCVVRLVLGLLNLAYVSVQPDQIPFRNALPVSWCTAVSAGHFPLSISTG